MLAQMWCQEDTLTLLSSVSRSQVASHLGQMAERDSVAAFSCCCAARSHPATCQHELPEQRLRQSAWDVESLSPAPLLLQG